MRRPRALRSGDRIALVAPASAFARDDFDAGAAELRRLGFEPVYEESVFARHFYTAGDASTRAGAFRRAWTDPSIAGLIAVRGGYGSMQILPLLDRTEIRAAPKPFIAYSDNTSLLAWLTTGCGLTAFHGPMIEGRLARGEAGYDLDTFTRAVMRAEPAGAITHPALEVLAPGEAAGMLLGGTLTQLAASLGTPFAFDPPRGHILFIDEVGERPYRIDRMLTQLRQAGLLARASAIVFGELPRCDEPGNAGPEIRTIVADVLADFPGPILFGLPSGHTNGACLTLPLGVRARVVTAPSPAVVIEEAAVTHA
ncbi:MAG TPA: LD-carboxypeptidase [Vicinamibacterales bacterium]|jgi:muramoyltetrapeptide carboxypeptidase|nr:LD-carboxypeptidase [Vicinamibacterales bacterium]